MDGATLRQSIRRLTAILVVPVSLLLIEFGIHLRETHGIVSGWISQVIAGSQALGALLVVGALAYLLVSVIASAVTGFG